MTGKIKVKGHKRKFAEITYVDRNGKREEYWIQNRYKTQTVNAIKRLGGKVKKIETFLR